MGIPTEASVLLSVPGGSKYLSKIRVSDCLRAKLPPDLWLDGGMEGGGGPCNLDLEDAAVSSPGGPVFLLMTPSCRFSRMHGCRWSFLQELQTRRHVRFHKRNRAARFPT